MLNTIFHNRYQIQELLSKKTGRITLLALDLQTKKSVIVKLLVFNNEFIWEDLKLFEREAQTLKSLNHHAIPKYLDYFEFDLPELKGFALVQTYINAPSLEKSFENGRRFTEDELKQIADKLLEILNYLHEHNPPVIHRDIKPSNILITNRSGNSIGDVYLVDFGSVQTVAKNKEGGTITIVGTYGYMPPEQYFGKAGPASDLYSLGMTIIYAATGTHPADFIQDDGQIKFNITGVSKQFKNWLETMTKSEINRRFASAQIAQNALNSSDVNISNYHELKPKGTKVKLHCESDCMEIILPLFTNLLGDIGGVLLYSLLYALVCLTFLSISSLSLLISAEISLYWSFLITYIICFIVTFWINFKIHKKITKISINNDKIKAYNIVGSKINKFSILTNLRSEISLLAYSPSYQFDKFFDSYGRPENRGIVKTEPEFYIYAGSNKYSITGLSDAEYLWLGKELSEFLDLELQIIYPTPKVPPESPHSGGGAGGI